MIFIMGVLGVVRGLTNDLSHVIPCYFNQISNSNSKLNYIQGSDSNS